MANWYIKEFIKLTGSSAQTLYHYDKIGLLKPSMRKPGSSYRIYSEADLLKQQQIIALKFFGFNLNQIKGLLAGNINLADNLRMQSELLEKKSQQLLEAKKTLDKIVAQDGDATDISWKTTTQLIEVYNRTQQLEQTFLGEMLSNETLKRYAHHETTLTTRIDAEGQAKLIEEWLLLMQQISDNLHKDPTTSTVGLAIGKKLTQMADSIYGAEYAGLKHILWEQVFMGHHLPQEAFNVSPEILKWLDLAARHYWLDHFVKILNRIDSDPDHKVLTAWNTALTELYGEDKQAKDKATKRVLQDDRLTDAAKIWLNNINK